MVKRSLFLIFFAAFIIGSSLPPLPPVPFVSPRASAVSGKPMATAPMPAGPTHAALAWDYYVTNYSAAPGDPFTLITNVSHAVPANIVFNIRVTSDFGRQWTWVSSASGFTWPFIADQPRQFYQVTASNIDNGLESPFLTGQ